MIRATSLQSAYQTRFTDGVHAGVADVPLAKGGAGEGFGPHDLLEAALATCMTITVQKQAIKLGITLQNVECRVTLHRPATGPAQLKCKLILEGVLTSEQRTELEAAARQCPVATTLLQSIVIAPEGETA